MKESKRDELLRELREDLRKAVEEYDLHQSRGGTPDVADRLRTVCRTCQLAVESVEAASDPYVIGRDVRVYKGRNVPIGTTGKVFWLGNGVYNAGRKQVQTRRLGLKDANGTVFWTAADNCEVVLVTF